MQLYLMDTDKNLLYGVENDLRTTYVAYKMQRLILHRLNFQLQKWTYKFEILKDDMEFQFSLGCFSSFFLIDSTEIFKTHYWLQIVLNHGQLYHGLL